MFLVFCDIEIVKFVGFMGKIIGIVVGCVVVYIVFVVGLMIYCKGW